MNIKKTKDIDMELNIDLLLQQGVSAHQAGNLQEAERCYKNILQTQSTHPHANHNLGALYVSINKSEITNTSILWLASRCKRLRLHDRDVRCT
jgi:thioredoxin-like negative regulator of GroEL